MRGRQGRFSLALVFWAALLLACPGAPEPSAEVPDEASTPESGTPASTGSTGTTEGSGPAPQPVPAAEPPKLDTPGARACASDDACRVMQPSDWDARVECCYEYPCSLDYLAINQSTWDALRAWRLANPFDCTQHLQREGPCAPRTERCGLDQEPPEARCREGMCEVAWPLDGPQPDPEAQLCSTRRDCLAYRATATSFQTRCCGQDCRSRWTAINGRTRVEIEAWSSQQAPACDAWFGAPECPSDEVCDPVVPPAVTCRDGQCGLAEAVP